MTAVTARVAGVKAVWVASPRPAPITLAAAYVAGADALLAVGGAQAIAALAYGAGDILFIKYSPSLYSCHVCCLFIHFDAPQMCQPAMLLLAQEIST